MKKITILLVAVIAATGLWWVTRPEPVAAVVATVKEDTVSRGDIEESVYTTGTIEPRRQFLIGSQVSGLVTAVHVETNALVKRGQLLAEIDPAPFQLLVNVQAANLERQTADIVNVEQQLDDARRQLARQQALFDQGLLTVQQLETAVLLVRTREAQVTGAKTLLVQAQAALNSAKLNLEYTRITAPIDGVILERRVDTGQTVQAAMNAPTFFVLSSPFDALGLTATVSEADVGRLRPGMPVKFTMAQFGRREFRGTVTAVRLAGTNNFSVITYPVQIAVANPELKFRPGMTAYLFIIVRKVTGVLRVPLAALKFRPTRSICAALGIAPPEGPTVRLADTQTATAVEEAPQQVQAGAGADKIDARFAPLPRPDMAVTIWTWDNTSRKFTAVPVRVGLADYDYAEVIAGDLKDGTSVVTGVSMGNKPAGGR